MIEEISFVPEEVKLDLYAGDGAALELALIDPADQSIPLDGEVRAQIRLRRDDPEVVQEFTVAVTGNVALLTLTGTQTAALGKFSGAWDCQWIPTGSQPITLVQGKARCLLDVTRV